MGAILGRGNVSTGMTMGKLIHPEGGGTMWKCGVREMRGCDGRASIRSARVELPLGQSAERVQQRRAGIAAPSGNTRKGVPPWAKAPSGYSSAEQEYEEECPPGPKRRAGIAAPSGNTRKSPPPGPKRRAGIRARVSPWAKAPSGNSSAERE